MTIYETDDGTGKWANPVRRGYKMACCDCGLVHRVDFRLVPHGRGKEIQFRVFRDERATAAMRKAKQVCVRST